MSTQERWICLGLFLTTLATLQLELLDSRLLSVLTWYHLSFIAISVAMLGAASGAVIVFVAGERLSGDRGRSILAPLSLLLGLVVPVTHLVLMQMRVPSVETGALSEIGLLALAIAIITLPFVLSGAIVTIALTRTGGRIGLLYGADLLGAALGCALVVPLLDWLDLFSSALWCGGLLALAAVAYTRGADGPAKLPALMLAFVLLVLALVHTGVGSPVRVAYPRGQYFDPGTIDRFYSNAHSYVTVAKPRQTLPFYWGAGPRQSRARVETANMLIDGGAGTVLTRWNGNPSRLEWVKHDVTSLPHHVRSGKVAVVGVGGGRDVLSALWGKSTEVTGIEINEAFVDVLERDYREFAQIANDSRVTLVNDDARAWLTRSDERFDVIQMSLVDTWAATGAGAFTLTENSLYTTEAWRVFLGRLAPGGILSTSRWFAPGRLSETSRLLSLAVASLLETGAERPADHIALVGQRRVATLLVSNEPLSAQDIEAIQRVADEIGFTVFALPGDAPRNKRLKSILESQSLEELGRAAVDPRFDFSPPSDARPFFFNMLRPSALLDYSSLRNADVDAGGGVVWGNVRATLTLGVLLLVALGLTLAIVGGPLLLSGLPEMEGGVFALSVSYFAAIGYGFMSIQIPLLQTFSVYLGHPIYTYSVTLFTMILFAGLGSLASDRAQRVGRSVSVVAALIVVSILAIALLLPLLVSSTISLELAGRVFVVVLVMAPLSFLLGFCFPFGIRLVDALSPTAAPWMWGVNGAAGVLASIVAVAVSMWAGIPTNFFVAAACYLLVLALGPALERRGLRC